VGLSIGRGKRFTESPEYKRLNEVVPGHSPGHFYSLIVDPEEARDYWERSSKKRVEGKRHGDRTYQIAQGPIDSCASHGGFGYRREK
jgi:hypothetical protein